MMVTDWIVARTRDQAWSFAHDRGLKPLQWGWVRSPDDWKLKGLLPSVRIHDAATGYMLVREGWNGLT